jgi:hypothetical protein
VASRSPQPGLGKRHNGRAARRDEQPANAADQEADCGYRQCRNQYAGGDFNKDEEEGPWGLADPANLA